MNAVADLFAPPPPIEPQAASGHVLCEFAGVALAIPQADVLTIEHGGELSAPLPGEAAAGWFASTQGPWPVYALDARLRLQAPAAGRSFLVFLHAQPTPLGILCESVRIVRSQAELPEHPLPPIMRNDALVKSAARLGAGQLALILYKGALATQLSAMAMTAADTAAYE